MCFVAEKDSDRNSILGQHDRRIEEGGEPHRRGSERDDITIQRSLEMVYCRGEISQDQPTTVSLFQINSWRDRHQRLVTRDLIKFLSCQPLGFCFFHSFYTQVTWSGQKILQKPDKKKFSFFIPVVLVLTFHFALRCLSQLPVKVSEAFLFGIS